MDEADGQSDPLVRRKVTDVCRQFLTSADAGLAQRLQDEEYGKKYDWNRETRKVARVDVPMAKTVHSEEEEKLQRDRFEFLQQQSRVADEDEQMAKQLQQQEQLNKQQEKAIAERDAEVALQLQRDEEKKKVLMASGIESNDARIALEMQKEEILGKERNRIKRELEDQALAQRYQEQERQLAEMRTLEKGLREQRHQLQLELHNGAQMEEALLGRGVGQIRLPNSQTVNRDTVAILSGASSGYRISDVEFLTEEDKLEIMKLQDEELAKALQEHEKKKAHRAHRAQREIAADIEERDYQLARIMQEVERLELAKRQIQGEGGTYVILPVPHVEPSMTTTSHVNTQRSDGTVNGARNVVESSRYSRVVSSSSNNSTGAVSASPPINDPPVYALANHNKNRQNNSTGNDSERLGSSSSSGASSASPQTSSPPPTTSPPPPPAWPPSSMSATPRPQYSTVTHTRVTETHVTSQPTPPARGSKNANTLPQGATGQGPPTRRQSSKDKSSCKSQ